MLLNLHVKNLALIEEADVYFHNGLNILSGETGAGKSIIIGSVNIGLGGKVPKDIIRKDCDYALVELLFQIDSPEKIKSLNEYDIDAKDGQILITRRLMNNKSIIKVNGVTCTASILRKITRQLIDVHGQHEHQSLLYNNTHLTILDKYAKNELIVLKEQLKTEYKIYSELRDRLLEFTTDEDERLRDISFTQFEIDEIENARLKIGEDEELARLSTKISRSKNILSGLSQVDELIGNESSTSASYAIGQAIREVAKLAELDDELASVFSQLEDIEALLNDVNRDINIYTSNMEFSDEEYEEIIERYDLINNLKAKYGNTIEDVLKYLEERKEKLDLLVNYEEKKAETEMLYKEQEEKVRALCEKISDIRKKKAELLSKDIKNALIELNFLDVQFDIAFEKTDNYTANGYDEIEFLISTNPGEEMKPLAKVASGGELSRIMLAIKTVLADKDEIETLIFDEIDTGISGRTAQKVSEKLGIIGKNRQVICITHLPQIASMADYHYLIEKNVVNNSTITSIEELDNEGMIKELARLLGGTVITDAVIENAREMKALADKTK